MDISFIKGVIPPVVTPVNKDDQVDEVVFRQIIEHVIGGGVHGVFVLGSNGEFYGLDYNEQKRAIEIAIDQVRGRVPVYAGIGAITTKESVKLAKMAEEAGTQAITVLPPMFISPNEEELYQHFVTIAEATSLPILIYNNPDRLKVNISANLVERLANIPNIVGAKDSSGDLTLTSEYIRRTRGNGFKVMAGRDTMILGTLVYGGVGCVAATANIAPKLVVKIYDTFMAGDIQGSLEAQYKLAPLRVAMGLGSWPVVTKDAMNLIGFQAGDPIKPNTSCSEVNMVKLKKILENMGLVK
ncbi:4-hydroxy-tetrahydrodipicolinate synthase [Pelosinus propionicus]|uniref:4-hydroxy-tetrahydrodipicolinate synthase n=1 Tax=Pelosinus propionicus DSM 13327 TaxID=1123291 RepID=A0A1I4L509_9FIRM|nr:4-hydroxy-tetrahydrodipicolinate synthase [Pelosinus propionicus]SFL86064.1 4-hydroxy-tetrahydrodipicolinate synthase [Pelosinus propionicus DSM 13327]